MFLGLIGVRGSVAMLASVASVHPKDMQVSKSKKSGKGNRANTDRASSGNRPFLRGQEPEPIIGSIEDVPQLEVIAFQMLYQFRMAGGRNQVFCFFLRLSHQGHLMLARVNVDVVGRDDATFHEELVRARAGHYVFELTDFLPCLVERRTVIDQGNWLVLQFVRCSDSSADLAAVLLDLFVT